MVDSVLIINYKTYAEARGKKGLELSILADSVSKEYNAQIIVVPQIPDLSLIVEKVDIPVFSQHIDSLPSGNATGHIDANTLLEIGISGTLLNHSERRLEISILEASIEICKSIGLKSVVCAGTIGLSGAIASLNPWAVAMEPPELIGGDISVTTRPEVVRSAVSAISDKSTTTLPLTGAGVKTDEHIKKAIELGSKGVLLASGIVKAKNQKETLEKMAKSLVNY
ncbi:MAG: triose-phosphate isomerase [Candidatus Heimdallarchaeota archaeon]|nr:triose-phosphate isomerase [Candidatus Heimdallarchaeota archaeon]MDH5647808.1 triose-phosphate isomerase [Candidatus Heimdallarchaeota archaeon]